jgi:hypothetical protein
MIELPSPDQLSARPYIYVCAPHAPTGPRVPGVLPPKVSVLVRSNADRIQAFTTENRAVFRRG